MIAWVSPSLMVSVTPLRISLAPSSVSTVTCRSLISSVLIVVSSLLEVCWSGRLYAVEGRGHVDVHTVVADLDREHRDGLGRGQAGGLAGAQVEAGAVQPALDLAVGHLALAERDGGVGAEVLHGEELVAVAGHRHVQVADGHAERLVRGHLVGCAHTLEGHQRSPPGSALRTFLASSASTVSVSLASMAGTSILRIRSLKKPCTTRRRASFSSIPRERR